MMISTLGVDLAKIPQNEIWVHFWVQI